MPAAGHHLYTAGRNTGLALSGQLSALQDHHQPTDILRLGAAAAQFDHLLPPTSAAFRPPHHPTSSPFFLPNFHHEVDQNTTSLIQTKPFSGGLLPLPDTAGSSSSSSAVAAAGLFNLAFFSNNNSNNNIIGDQLSNGNGNGSGAEAPATLFSGGSMIDADGGGHGHIPPLYNEPALPQMSATALLQKAAQMGATTSSNGGAFLRAFGSSSSSNKFDRPPGSSFLPATMRSQMETDNHLQDLMNSLANGGSDGLTRDFLGVGGIMRSIGREHGGGHGRHHGIDISSLDGDMKSKAGGMRPSFGGGT